MLAGPQIESNEPIRTHRQTDSHDRPVSEPGQRDELISGRRANYFAIKTSVLCQQSRFLLIHRDPELRAKMAEYRSPLAQWKLGYTQNFAITMYLAG